MMNTILIRRILVVLIIILGLGITWMTYRAIQVTIDSQTADVSGTVLRNAFFPTPDNDQIRYYNGDAFVYLDTTTNSIGALSQVRGITDVTRVDWLKNGVVFSVGSASPWHPVWSLYNDYSSRLEGDNEENSFSGDEELANYHWYLSFKDNSIKLLSVGVDNALLFATPTTSGGLLYREYPYYSLIRADGTVTKNISSIQTDSERRILQVTDTGYVYLKEKGSDVAVGRHTFADKKDSELIAKLYSTQNRSIYDQVAMSGNIIYFLEPTGVGSVSSVHSIDTATKKVSRLVDSFQGVIRQQNGTVTGTHIGNELTKLYVFNDMQQTKTSKNSYTKASYILPVRNGLFMAANNGYVQKVGSGSPVRSDVALEKKITSTDFVLSRNIESLNDNSYTVTFISGKLSDRMNQLYKAVADAGYNPLEFSFTANPGPLVQY